ncbi:MAG: hypothetical protein V4691_01300 [Pseudomonadota bacterium]
MKIRASSVASGQLHRRRRAGNNSARNKAVNSKPDTAKKNQPTIQKKSRTVPKVSVNNNIIFGDVVEFSIVKIDTSKKPVLNNFSPVFQLPKKNTNYDLKNNLNLLHQNIFTPKKTNKFIFSSSPFIQPLNLQGVRPENIKDVFVRSSSKDKNRSDAGTSFQDREQSYFLNPGLVGANINGQIFGSRKFRKSYFKGWFSPSHLESELKIVNKYLPPKNQISSFGYGDYDGCAICGAAQIGVNNAQTNLLLSDPRNEFTFARARLTDSFDLSELNESELVEISNSSQLKRISNPKTPDRIYQVNDICLNSEGKYVPNYFSEKGKPYNLIDADKIDMFGKPTQLGKYWNDVHMEDARKYVQKITSEQSFKDLSRIDDDLRKLKASSEIPRASVRFGNGLMAFGAGLSFYNGYKSYTNYQNVLANKNGNKSDPNVRKAGFNFGLTATSEGINLSTMAVSYAPQAINAGSKFLPILGEALPYVGPIAQKAGPVGLAVGTALMIAAPTWVEQYEKYAEGKQSGISSALKSTVGLTVYAPEKIGRSVTEYFINIPHRMQQNLEDTKKDKEAWSSGEMSTGYLIDRHIRRTFKSPGMDIPLNPLGAIGSVYNWARWGLSKLGVESAAEDGIDQDKQYKYRLKNSIDTAYEKLSTLATDGVDASNKVRMWEE